MTDEQTVCAEVARDEFNRFLDVMAIEGVPEDKVDAEDNEGYKDARHKVERAIMAGRMSIDDEGRPVFMTQTGVITFNEPTGATLMAADRKKKAEDASKMIAMMADMTQLPAKTFGAMRMSDLKVCMAVTLLFLG